MKATQTPGRMPINRAVLHSRRAQGFTLIELMVGIAIALVLIAAVIQGFASSSATINTNASVAEANTNGRYALEFLKREIRHAALHKLVWSGEQVNHPDATLSAKDFGCGAGMVINIATGVSGFNDNNPYSASCLQSDAQREYARGDVLVLRRTKLQPTATFLVGAPYVRLAYGVANTFTGDGTATVPPPSEGLKYDYGLVSDVYYINAFTSSADESPKVPALFRLTLSNTANPQMTPELVASNVEQLQIQYGQADAAGNTQYVNANAVTDWTMVKTARIWLLLRESKPEGGIVSGEYTLGDVTYKPADHFRRSVLSTTLAIRNL
jgi:type IV pilus assembly protein PilW